MLLILLVLTLVFGVLLWILSVILQGWLYNDVAKLLPVRALAAGLVMALFHTGWCAVYKEDPGRFDTLFSFKRELLDKSYDEIQSVRKVGKEEKKPAIFVRKGATPEFMSSDTQKPWKRSDADGMVVALLVREEGRSQPTRFNTVLQPDGTFPPGPARFVEDKGSRYMDEVLLGKVYRIRPYAIMGNLAVNFLHAALWGFVLWLGLRFAIGHAIGFGLAIWLGVMLCQGALFDFVTK